MNVSAIIVTRGDVTLDPVLESLPSTWEVLIWDNGDESLVNWGAGLQFLDHSEAGGGHAGPEIFGIADLSVYGRYAAIEHASHDLIYVQDDDVIVSDPQAILEEWELRATRPPWNECKGEMWDYYKHDHLVANMPQEFRHDGYADSCLVGFGACFHRDLPARMFQRFTDGIYAMPGTGERYDSLDGLADDLWFQRTCDVVLTTLAPARVLVDVPKANREFAEDFDRMYRQPYHVGERQRMLEIARKVRDAA